MIIVIHHSLSPIRGSFGHSTIPFQLKTLLSINNSNQNNNNVANTTNDTFFHLDDMDNNIMRSVVVLVLQPKPRRVTVSLSPYLLSVHSSHKQFHLLHYTLSLFTTIASPVTFLFCPEIQLRFS